MKRTWSLSVVFALTLVGLAGCGRGWFQTAGREPWRRDAEIACIKSGTVKENQHLVRIEPINGPGICGAEFPLKVVAFGEGPLALGYSQDMRPPGGIPTGGQPRWPVNAPSAPQAYPVESVEGAPLNAPGAKPMSISAPGLAPPEDEDIAADDGSPPVDHAPQNAPYMRRAPQQQAPVPPLGPQRGPQVAQVGAVAIKPTATLACPIVSALDRWILDAVQPAAMRWFGTPVAEIKQISAYSCRGMNGNPRARISEHAFGNALDIAAFVLADGRKITVKNGWKGLPEEQGFLRDVQGAACQQFNTVLAPGSNIYHYDHIHVDLMRRSSGRVICQPAAVSGEAVAARANGGRYAGQDAQREPGVTGSIKPKRAFSFARPAANDDDGIEDESNVR